jgi:hypothetical protein
MATVNPASGELVLGPLFPKSTKSYEQIAHANGATYFNMGEAYERIYADLEADVGPENAREAMWRIKRQFLDQQLAKGKTVYFTVDPRSLPKPSETYKEWTYIQKRLGGEVKLKKIGQCWVVLRR